VEQLQRHTGGDGGGVGVAWAVTPFKKEFDALFDSAPSSATAVTSLPLLPPSIDSSSTSSSMVGGDSDDAAQEQQQNPQQPLSSSSSSFSWMPAEGDSPEEAQRKKKLRWCRNRRRRGTCVRACVRNASCVMRRRTSEELGQWSGVE
jgi:hypothetical protein